MDQILERESEKATLGAAPKDLFPDMFYVKALDIPEKGP